MCFSKLSQEEAAFRAAMISREIRNRLIGQGENPDNAYVRSIAARIRVTEQGESNEVSPAAMLDGFEPGTRTGRARGQVDIAGRPVGRGVRALAGSRTQPGAGRGRAGGHAAVAGASDPSALWRRYRRRRWRPSTWTG